MAPLLCCNSTNSNGPPPVLQQVALDEVLNGIVRCIYVKILDAEAEDDQHADTMLGLADAALYTLDPSSKPTSASVSRSQSDSQSDSPRPRVHMSRSIAHMTHNSSTNFSFAASSPIVDTVSANTKVQHTCTARYTLYTVHCTLYTIHCTLYTVHYSTNASRASRR
jgi:hypothetical protein